MDNKQTKSKLASKRSESDDKQSYRRGWRSSSFATKCGIVFGGLGTAAALGYLGVSIWQTLQTKWSVQLQHAPLVINNRPPELLQPFICDPEKGRVHIGNWQTFVKNVGNAQAVNVWPYWWELKIIPERKTGDSFIDDLPLTNCDMKPANTGALPFNLAPGREMRPQIRQAVMAYPKLAERTAVQLYLASCIYYSDEYGVNHGTCDTYGLNVPSDNPLDVLGGSPSFICDSTPKIGKFVWHVTGHCQK